MATALTSEYTRFTDKCNKVLAGGIVKTFEPNSLTPKISYQDPNKEIPNLTEVRLDETGRAKIYIDGDYRIQVYSRDGILIEDNLLVEQSLVQRDFVELSQSLQVEQQVTLNQVQAQTSEALSDFVDNTNAAVNEIKRAAGNFSFTTMAAFNAAKATIPANSTVNIDEVGANQGLNTWNGTALTKSPYDPLTQSKTYTDTEIAERIDQINNSQYVAIFEDNNGNIAIGIKPDGSVSIPKLDSDIALNVLDQAAQDASTKANAAEANAKTYADTKANAAEANAKTYTDTKLAQVGGDYKTLSIGNDDSIMHFGDSLSAGTYNVQHKAYICQLSQVSPFRHINYSDSGKMLINFHNFLLSDTQLFSATIKQHMPKYTIIATLVNDYTYGNADIKYTQENLRRLIDNLLALGTTPVIFVEFTTTTEQHQAYKVVADEYKIPFISALELNKKIGGYTWVKELFHQPHVGMRTSHLFTLPMLDWIEQQLPLRTIKIYRKRATFTASTDADLLYKDVIDKSKKWQEIGIAHTYLRNPQYYDEIGETAGANLLGSQSLDDYVKIQKNQNVTFTDYALIEIGLDAFARDVDEIKINLGLSTTPLAYIRNNLDPSVALAAGAWNSTDYQSKYALPRGAWKSVNVVGGILTIAKADVVYSMVGNKVQLMLKGAFNLNALRVDYIASKYQTSQPVITQIKRQFGTELLTQHLTDATSLAGWTKVGTVNALVPIDRKPLKNDGAAVAGVCTLTTSNSIAQSVAITSSEDMRTFKVTVLARYFPKAWVDLTNATYTVLDSNQTLDRNTQPAPITTSSLDVCELKLETWVGTSIPTATGGTAKHIKPVFMLWKPVEFFVDVEPFATQLNIRLSAVEGEVQVAKVSVKEVL